MTSPISNSRGVLRKLVLAMVSVALFFLLILGIVSFVLSTEAGSQWALTRAVATLNDGGDLTFDVENTKGTIYRGLSFDRLRLVNDSVVVVVRNLRTSWNPYSLLTGRLLLSDLWISSLEIEVLENEALESELEYGGISNPLPIDVTLSRLRIERLVLAQQGEATLVRSISLGAELDDAGLAISSLKLDAQGAEVSGDVSIGFTDRLNLNGLLEWRYSLANGNSPEELAGRLQLTGDLVSLGIDHQLESPQRVRSVGNITTGLLEGIFEFDLTHTADTATLPIEIPADYSLNNISLRTLGNLEEIELGLQSDLQYEQYPSVRIDARANYTDSMLNIASYNIVEAENSISGAATIDWSAVPRIEGSYALLLPDIESFIDLPASIELAGLAISGRYDLDLPEEGAEGSLVVEAFDGLLSGYPLQGQGTLFFREGDFVVEGLQILTQNNRLGIDGIYADTVDLQWSLSAASLDEFLAGSSGILEGQGSLQGDPAALDIDGLLSGRNLSYQQLQTGQLEFAFQRLAGRVRSELSIDTLSYTDDSISESFAAIEVLASGTEANHRIEMSAKSKFGDIAARVTGGLGDLQSFTWQGVLENAAIDTPAGSWSTSSASAVVIDSAQLTFSESCWMQQEAALCIALQRSVDAGITASGSLRDYPLSIFNSGRVLNADAGPNLAQEHLLAIPQLPLGSSIEGQVGGQFALTLDADDVLEVDFSLAASEAALRIMPEQMESAENFDEDALPQEYDLEVLQIAGALREGGWRLSGQAGILRENLDDSEIDVRGEIAANVDIAPDGSLGGTIDAGLEDLRWLQAMAPEFSNITGTLNAQARLGGDLSAPGATGAIDLQVASVSLDRLGIVLRNISASVSSNSRESIQLIGQAQSSSGFIEFNGEILGPFGSAPVLSAEVRGDDFQLANIPNLQLHVSPNVVLNADAASIEVIGSLNVPVLKLTLEQLPETAVDVSRDVVIVSYPEDRPDLARSIAASETTAFDRPLAGVIDISLGDDVSFSGFGMSTKLAGNLNVQQTVGGSNRTYGELSIVEGSYEMYRQSLNISQGKLLFFGAYDNPGIDLRATREVEGFTVGVLMNGTLKNINSQLFSTPALADNDIISVLVTGRPFSEMGQQAGDGDAVLAAIAKLGVGRSEGLTNQVRSKLGLDVLTVDPTNDINNSVLTIGKYLTPDIFVRYGVGLFDSQSKVAVDYTLSDRVKLQAESGEYQSVDIIYSVER